MKILICVQKKEKAKVVMIGKNKDGLVMVTAACKAIIEKISEEKRISLDNAKKEVLKIIEEAMDSLN